MRPSSAVWLALPLVAVLAGAAAITLAEGPPRPLPGVSMGSVMVLHVERVVALFALAVGVISVLREARRGRLPTQLSTGGLAYESEMSSQRLRFEAEIEHRVDAMQEQVVALVNVVEGLKSPE
jgi:hypothetical protein